MIDPLPAITLDSDYKLLLSTPLYSCYEFSVSYYAYFVMTPACTIVWYGGSHFGPIHHPDVIYLCVCDQYQILWHTGDIPMFYCPVESRLVQRRIFGKNF